MNNKYIEPPKYLFEKIMDRIHKEQRLLMLKKRIAIFSIGLAGSLAALAPAFKMVSSGFTESGFIQFFSLLFSDFEIVLAYWPNFVLALLETLPIISLALFLTIIFVFLESLRFLTRDLKSAFSTPYN